MEEIKYKCPYMGEFAGLYAVYNCTNMMECGGCTINQPTHDCIAKPITTIIRTDRKIDMDRVKYLDTPYDLIVKCPKCGTEIRIEIEDQEPNNLWGEDEFPFFCPNDECKLSEDGLVVTLKYDLQITAVSEVRSQEE